MGFPLTESVVEMLMEEMKEYILLVQLISHAVFVLKSSNFLMAIFHQHTRIYHTSKNEIMLYLLQRKMYLVKTHLD